MRLDGRIQVSEGVTLGSIESSTDTCIRNRLRIVFRPAKPWVLPHTDGVFITPNAIIIEPSQHVEEGLLVSRWLGHKLLLNHKVVAAGKRNNSRNLLTLDRAHNLLERQMTVHHHKNHATTTNANALDALTDDVKIGNTLPKSTPFLAQL